MVAVAPDAPTAQLPPGRQVPVVGSIQRGVAITSALALQLSMTVAVNDTGTAFIGIWAGELQDRTGAVTSLTVTVVEQEL
jgi:hypothetical protein